MFDFFNHHRYKEFEVSESIDLKTTNLEVIEIYKLFKAYLLLKYNILRTYTRYPPLLLYIIF